MLSKAEFIKTINHTDKNNNEGVRYTITTSMDMSMPSILILGGENTRSDITAFTYCRSIADTLRFNNIHSGVNLYSAYYNFGSAPFCRDGNRDRWILFYKFRAPDQMIQMQAESQLDMAASYRLYETAPQYITDIYNFALKPRFYDGQNQLYSESQIRQNLRNMVIFAHCHGAYVVRMLEQTLLADSNIQQLLSRQPRLLQNLIIINHAPFAPLENCQFTSLSFASASDDQARLYTTLDSQMQLAPTECTPSPAFLGPKYGNIIVADRLKLNAKDEHSHIGLRGSDFTNKKLTNSGKILFSVERNALLMAVRTMIKKKPLPTIPQMLTTQQTKYNELKKRGNIIARHYLRKKQPGK